MVTVGTSGMIQNIVVTNNHVIAHTHTYLLVIFNVLLRNAEYTACYSFCFAYLGKLGGLPFASKCICIKYEAI